ncbi:MAG: hypothetical protein QOK04_23 [Solirubrobacteraceae bacterium]|nr:hypothetical protein [Solirubrobacteraceae bacterium]
MDTTARDDERTTSAAGVARELGTSVPRVVRAAKRLGFDERSHRGRLQLTSQQVRSLRAALGRREEADGLSTAETTALAALARAPFGLSSARAVARQADLSPTAAAGAVRRLIEQGLVTQEDAVIVAGRPRHVRLLHANRHHPRYREVAAALQRVEPPLPERDERVPARLRHLFWNTSPTQLEVERGGDYIARRLLRTLDPAGLAWGARNLDGSHWRAAAQARGLDPAVRALAENLAAGAQR